MPGKSNSYLIILHPASKSKVLRPFFVQNVHNRAENLYYSCVSILSPIHVLFSIRKQKNRFDLKEDNIMNMASTSVKRRFEELDLARALPLLLLPLVHVYEEFESINALPESLLANYSWILKLCNLMPSVFMILMGANIYFSRKSTAKDLLKRGLTFIVIGLGLNFFRFILPSIITSLINGDFDAVFGEYGSLYYTLSPDIYDFVGIAFIVFAAFKAMKFSPLAILLASSAMLAIDGIIPQFETSCLNLNAFLGRFIYMDEDSCFPLLTWMIFPAVGYCFGCVYKGFETEEKRCSFVKKMFATSLVGLLVVWFSLLSYKLDPMLIMTSPANDYITDFPNVLLLTFLAGIWFAMFYFIYFRIKETKLCKSLIVISKGILPFYIAQWIVIGWAEYLVDGLTDYEDYSLFSYTDFWILTVITTLVAVVTVPVYNKIKAKKKEKNASRISTEVHAA